MKKLKTILFYLLAGYVLPLIGKPGLILHGQIVLLMFVAVIMILSQPAIDLAEVRERQSTDRYSSLWITALVQPAVIVPVAEWAYFGSMAPTPATSVADAMDFARSFDLLAASPGTLWAALGLCLIAGGLALRIWAIGTLGRAFTTTVQVQKGQVLVSTGPYHLVRHPSYLGAYGAFLGCAVFLQAWIGLVVAAACMGLAYAIRIPAEERVLKEHFGAEWSEYCQRTRWCMAPGVW